MEYLEELKKIARKNYIPIIKDDGLNFLVDFCKLHNPKSILEIGTCVGYSGTMMLKNTCNSNLTTIEINQDFFQKAKQTFEKMGLSKRVKCILGDAKDVIKTLDEKYDLIFLDGPKGQYLNYYPILKSLLNDGGYIIADNVYFHGLVKGEEFVKHKLRTIVVNLRKFLKTIEEDKDVKVEVLDIGDGIAVIKK